MAFNTLSLEKALFYLFVLTYDDKEISKMTLNTIAIDIQGSTMNKEVLIDGLKYRIGIIMENNFREELTFGFTREEFPNINPKYYDRTITYNVRKIGDEISITNVSY